MGAAIVMILPQLMTNIWKEVTPLNNLILEVKFKPLPKVIYSRNIKVNLIPDPMRFRIIFKDMYRIFTRMGVSRALRVWKDLASSQEALMEDSILLEEPKEEFEFRFHTMFPKPIHLDLWS